MGIQCCLRGAAAGSAAGLPCPPGVCGTTAHPAGAVAGCYQDPGDVARIHLISVWGACKPWVAVCSILQQVQGGPVLAALYV